MNDKEWGQIKDYVRKEIMAHDAYSIFDCPVCRHRTIAIKEYNLLARNIPGASWPCDPTWFYDRQCLNCGRYFMLDNSPRPYKEVICDNGTWRTIP